MVNLNFSDQIIKSARSVQASVCDFIGCIGVQKYMTVLLCMALLFSSNSHSENNDLVSWIIIMYEKQSN